MSNALRGVPNPVTGGRLTHPARLVPLGFLAVVAIGTVLLALPVSRTGGGPADWLVCLFTTVSATCVTGLVTVDTATYWTPFGQTVLMVLMQVGGFGVMALATLLVMLVRGRLRVNDQLLAQAETHTVNFGDVRGVLSRIALVGVGIEAVVFVILTLRFRIAYTDEWGTALWQGLFHAVSSFNNAGFALFSDNLMGFVGDPWISWTLCASLVLGGLGFPVLMELYARGRNVRHWSVTTRLTLWGTALLLAVGILAFGAVEWNNPRTIGGLPWPDKVVASVTGGVVPRTAGFNSIDYGQAMPETEFVTTGLMFIGGGSAGTAGGIKVTTFLLLAAVIWAEVQGREDVVVGRRRIGHDVQRQALSVALLGMGLCTVGSLAVLSVTDYSFDKVLFECVSAFGTVGLSTGITPDLPPSAQGVLMVMMFLGRVGTITVATALALRSTRPHHHLPQERPIVG